MQIFLTGITGFLGGELLVELSKNTEIEKIYCLVRAIDQENTFKRIKKVFDFHGDYLDTQKIIPVFGDLTDSQLSKKLIGNKSTKFN